MRRLLSHSAWPPHMVSAAGVSVAWLRHISYTHATPSTSTSNIRRWHTPITRSAGSYLARSSPFLYTSQHLQSSSTDQQDLYTILGVRPDATQDEIKSAYKKLALEFHPDHNHNPGAEERFKSISAAYSVVGHKDKRREYDAQRAMMRGMGGMGNAGGYSSSGAGTGGYGSSDFPSGGMGRGSYQYQQMSKEEADRLFRELFGGMRVDQIFKNLEEEMRRGGMQGGGLGGNVGRSFPGAEQTFRPFFRAESTSSNIYEDGQGNQMEETTYTDPRGRRFTVRRTSSTDPNASTNQIGEDFYRSRFAGKDGRHHFGNASAQFRRASDDFTQNVFGVRSHGRHPLVAFLMLGAWLVVLGTLFFCTLGFLARHPLFFASVLILILLGRAARSPF